MLYPIGLRAQGAEFRGGPETVHRRLLGPRGDSDGGEGGIRTHDELLTHTPLAGERLRPDSATSPRARMLPAPRRPWTSADTLRDGGMAERTIATVLKTVEPHGFGGSNPPPSATELPSPAVGTRPDSVPDAGAQVGQPVVSREGRLGGLLAHGLAVGTGGWIGPQELHLAVLHVEVP